MSPHTMLSNMATISADADRRSIVASSGESMFQRRESCAAANFGSYIESLVTQAPRMSYLGLLSPTDTDGGFLVPLSPTSSTMKESIDSAILNSTTISASKRSPRRYEIMRSGHRLAVITLARSAWRLGEIIPVIIDFQASDVPCYSLNATLETSESIDQAIAIRSKSSILRATRRVHACQFEPTIAAKKILFRPLIPLSSTPEFITSGINLEWKLRFEFVIGRLDDPKETTDELHNLIEEVARDDRGIVKAALQDLPCETFDISVPLRIYGSIAAFDDGKETLNHPI